MLGIIIFILMTIDNIEEEILFYISLKTPKRIELAPETVEYVFKGNEIKQSQKRLQIQKKPDNYSIFLDTELKNKKVVSSNKHVDLTMNSSVLNDVLLDLFLSHESKEKAFQKNNSSGLFPKLKNYIKVSLFNWI